MRALAVLILFVIVGVAAAEPSPKRKVIVLEYRSNSAALPGVSSRVVATMHAQTSLDVLGPDQTRALYGEHLDQVIVKCAGEADCIARIGQKVGAAGRQAVVGIAALGDRDRRTGGEHVACRGVGVEVVAVPHAAGLEFTRLNRQSVRPEVAGVLDPRRSCVVVRPDAIAAPRQVIDRLSRVMTAVAVEEAERHRVVREPTGGRRKWRHHKCDNPDDGEKALHPTAANVDSLSKVSIPSSR